MERINKFYLIVGLAIAAILLIGFVANADELDKATTIAFSAPVNIPGQVLPAGPTSALGTQQTIQAGSQPKMQ